ncbi:LOW QUALITY PROTEIN: PDZ domain-containing protein 4 [Gavia stellata]|uniref:LOW QUALITY PROTEIN: PDZ domain-containing protein 4 n=1 Tax=Gavia stellata TaxID=37040 RepID=UPI00289D0819|nr:LOW QUALITY PROTEIN: PDZ domain-containing protein 4 [Gavia stellata]
MGCNMCVVQKPEEQHRVMLQVSGKEGPRRGPEPCRGARGGPREPLVLQVLRRSRPSPNPLGTTAEALPPYTGPLRPPRDPPRPPRPPLPHDYFDPTDLGEPERPEELEYEEVELYKASHRDKLGLTVCYRTDGEEDAGIYVGEVNPNSIAAKDGRIREGDRIIQINGVEVQDREEAVAFLTREQQTNISLLLARPESQLGTRWKDSDREDFLDDFGSDEDGELRQAGALDPPGAGRGAKWGGGGAPPSPATPCPRGAEPDSGVGRTDESTRNEESSEHDLLGDEGGEGPPPLALLEEELRHLEFKCRHLLRAQKMERLRERCLRAWLEAAGAEPPLADISEAPERDSTSAYNTGESCRSSPPLRGLGGPPRPGRDRLLKARAIKILEERGGGSTTDDDARSELKTGRYWSREQRKQHLARARAQRRRRELLLQSRAEGGGGGGGRRRRGRPRRRGRRGGGAAATAPWRRGRRGLRKRSRRILDNWVTIQEMLARGTRAADGGRVYNPLLSVTTV